MYGAAQCHWIDKYCFLNLHGAVKSKISYCHALKLIWKQQEVFSSKSISVIGGKNVQSRKSCGHKPVAGMYTSRRSVHTNQQNHMCCTVGRRWDVYTNTSYDGRIVWKMDVYLIQGGRFCAGALKKQIIKTWKQ